MLTHSNANDHRTSCTWCWERKIDSRAWKIAKDDNFLVWVCLTHISNLSRACNSCKTTQFVTLMLLPMFMLFPLLASSCRRLLLSTILWTQNTKQQKSKPHVCARRTTPATKNRRVKIAFSILMSSYITQTHRFSTPFSTETGSNNTAKNTRAIWFRCLCTSSDYNFFRSVKNLKTKRKFCIIFYRRYFFFVLSKSTISFNRRQKITTNGIKIFQQYEEIFT